MPTKKTAKKAAKTARVSPEPKAPARRGPAALPTAKSAGKKTAKAAGKVVAKTTTPAPAKRKAEQPVRAKTTASRKSTTPAAPKAPASAAAAPVATKKSAAKVEATESATAQGKAKSRKAVPPVEPVRVGAGAPETAADMVDSQLEKYRSMRDFSVTAEPSGAEANAKATKDAPKPAAARGRANNAGLPFVIQKHAASHLHYDFRLGWSGVLKSWAVAKGPSFVVADRRLAVQVEDHPMEYGGFEGTIPKGQYGGGTVMLWDQGTWWPQPGHENVDAGLRTGSLKFELNGSKLHGKWTLVRMHTTKPYGGDSGRWKNNDKPQWLLIKEHDEYERQATDPPIVDAEPRSALTGRTMDEIAQANDHTWNSKETAGPGQAWARTEIAAPETPVAAGATAPVAPSPAQPAPASSTPVGATPERATALRIAPRPRPVVTAPGPRPLSGAALPASVLEALDDLPREPQPEFIQPQLAQEAEAPPEGPGWLHELKLDGYRMQARKSARGVQMLTRSGLDWTYRVPAVAEAVARLPLEAVTLDGEVVVLAPDGTTNFANLQASFQNGDHHPLNFFCFDLLHLAGRNPRNLALRERKRLLAALLPLADASETAVLRYSEHLETSGRVMFEQACQLHAEGIISKRANEPYTAGRRAGWLKSKCLHEQEFVVGGFSPSADGPDRIGSLLLGYYRDGKLIFAGRTGTGFTQAQRRQLFTQLDPLRAKTTSFLQVPADQRRDALWVRPELVAQVRFATWTAEDLVRQAAFLGLREDKRPEEVFREAPTKPPQPKSNERKQHAADVPVKEPSSADEEAAKPPRPAAKSVAQPAAAPVRLTHPSKILDPESSLRKQQLADYYWAVAERMLPHIADRPLSLVRCPNGAGKPCFYQKHVNSMLPPGIGSVMVADKKGGSPEPYITLNTPEALAGLAQIGVLEVHPWGSTNAVLECPDRLTLDLDPDEALPWSVVSAAAAEVRHRLKGVGLESFLKTTGGKGLHIVAPIAPTLDFATVKDLAHRFVVVMERANPRLYLTKMTKAARTGKIYLDYLRNERGATAVAPFSPRARPGVAVSVPLDWKELEVTERPSFAVSNFPEWKERLRRDPWKRMASLNQQLDPARLRSA